jgi:hypothetical protein
MTRTLAALAFALVLPLSAARSQPKEPFTPGLGEIMTLQQMRHLKLWYAGQAGNWPLADYELDELKEGFEDIVKYHPTHDDVPTGTMATAVVDGEVAALDKAIAARDRKQFTVGFDKLTAACNACHQAAKHAFIVVQRPTGNPYTNQSFAPLRNAETKSHQHKH